MSEHVMLVDGNPVMVFHTENDAPVTYSSSGEQHYAHQDGTLVAFWRHCR